MISFDYDIVKPINGGFFSSQIYDFLRSKPEFHFFYKLEVDGCVLFAFSKKIDITNKVIDLYPLEVILSCNSSTTPTMTTKTDYICLAELTERFWGNYQLHGACLFHDKNETCDFCYKDGVPQGVRVPLIKEW